MRQDDISQFYNTSSRLNRIKKLCFYVNVLCAFVACFVKGGFYEFAITVQILLAVVYVMIDIIDDGVFWFQAESFRRKNSIENAFGVDLSEYKTEGYYNNSFSPSIKRYGVNIFESNFFSYHIGRAMLIKSVCGSIIAVIAFVLSCIYLTSDLIVVIAETVFSALILVDTVYLIIYVSKMKTIYEEAYSQFISIGISKNQQMIWLLSYAMEYESIKTHYKVRLDGKIFASKNKELSDKWETMQSKIRFE